MPQNFLEINRYFALTSYCNTIGRSNNTFSRIRVFFGGKTKSPMCFDVFIHWLIKQVTNTYRNHRFQGHTKIVLFAMELQTELVVNGNITASNSCQKDVFPRHYFKRHKQTSFEKLLKKFVHLASFCPSCVIYNFILTF